MLGGRGGDHRGGGNLQRALGVKRTRGKEGGGGGGLKQVLGGGRDQGGKGDLQQVLRGESTRTISSRRWGLKVRRVTGSR